MIRRVETGVDRSGKAVFVRDAGVEPLAAGSRPHGPHLIWGADSVPAVPNDGSEPSWGPYFPPPGGCRIIVVDIPPAAEAEAVDAAAKARLEALVPGLVSGAAWDDGVPGMHLTRTVDVGFVLEGSITLQLDSGETRELTRGDWFVQNGTWHAWVNSSDSPCRLVGVMMGAELAAAAERGNPADGA